MEGAFSRRLALLAEKEDKTPTDLDELTRLTESLIRLRASRSREKTEQGNPGKNNSGGKGRARSNTRKKNNDVSGLTAADFKEKLHKNYFEYQSAMREERFHRMRMYIKSRQIGATWYFSQEAFEDATLEARNKIFLSATRAQSETFRRYIIACAQQNFDIELKGNPIILNTKKGPAELHFLSNNSKSAQSYHGDVYIDEFFWILGFNELYKVASGMAAHKKWRKTLFSTPSAVTHQAYDLWTGDRYNQRFKKKRVEFPGFKEMQSGILCPDSIFRKIITLDDAESGGCDLFDRAQLLLEYSPEEFKNLFMCLFVDDTFGVFKFADLSGCAVDTGAWNDINWLARRPLENYPVWGGYDPSRTRDDASFVILMPPLQPGGKFRVIKRLKWVNKSYPYQADQIRDLCSRFNFSYMGIDTTGPGIGVFDTVKNFFPQATPIHYSVSNKTHMVLKAQEVIESNRIEWDENATDISHAFLTIRKTTTTGGQITYAARRTDTTGHADVAWAIMHALANEPIANGHRPKSIAEIL